MNISLLHKKVKTIRLFILKGVLLFLLLGICSFQESLEKKRSVVSYYHDKFNGKRTASGEIFNNKELTAANRILPFGTKVKITNVKNQKSVIVRVNDRGPFSKTRAFDLSKAAFREISDLRSGTAVVEYEILKDEET